MTKVQVQYDLIRPLTDLDAKGVSDAHGYYGIQRVHVAPTLDKITVEWDASRLTEQDVEAALVRYGIPLKRRWQVP